jgi:hypothetical protein
VRKGSVTSPAHGPLRRFRPWLAAAAILVLGVAGFLAVRGLRESVEVARRDETAGRAAPPPSADLPLAVEPEVEPPAVRAPAEPGSAMVASPVGDGEAIGIVLNVEAPFPRERWADEVIRLEADLRASFGAPVPKTEAMLRDDAAASGAAEASGEAERQDAARGAASAVAAAPRAEDLRIDIEGQRLPLLIERVEAWAKDAGGSVRVEGGEAVPALFARARAARPAAGGAGDSPGGRIRVQLKLSPGGAEKSP